MCGSTHAVSPWEIVRQPYQLWIQQQWTGQVQFAVAYRKGGWVTRRYREETEKRGERDRIKPQWKPAGESDLPAKSRFSELNPIPRVAYLCSICQKEWCIVLLVFFRVLKDRRWSQWSRFPDPKGEFSRFK